MESTSQILFYCQATLQYILLETKHGLMEEHSACLLISLFSLQAVELEHKDHCFQTFHFILQNDKKLFKIFELIWQL